MENKKTFKDLCGILCLIHLCGAARFESRIVGGSNAYEGQFPYQVAVLPRGALCGGAIISANYVLTAAHCVVNAQASETTIRAGSLRLNNGGQVAGVSEIKVHPYYNNFNNDIALLKLSTPLQFNNAVQPVTLATQAPPTGAPVVISGWGGLYTGGPIADILQYATVSAESYYDCTISAVPISVICLAHTSGIGSCSGDSGGPAVYNNQLVGVCSYGVGGCGTSNSDGYGSVAYNIIWIRNNSDA